MNTDQIKTIISETLGVAKDQIQADSSLFDDFNCSPLEVNDLMIKICHKLNLNYNIDDNNMPKLNTVQDIILFCEEHSDDI